MSKKFEKVFVAYDEMFCDEISINILYQNKGNINGYEDDKGNLLTRKEVMDWLMENHYNHKAYMEWCSSTKGKTVDNEKALYLYDEKYRELVDMERLYMLYLMGIEITKIAEIFGVSRPTVYKKIKTYLCLSQ